MPTTITKQHILIAVSLLLLAIIGYVSVITVDRSGKTAIHLSAYPRDITVTIDGNKTDTGTIYLSPGTYVVKSSKEGYDDYSKTVVLEDIAQTVPVILIPNTEATRKLSSADEVEYRKAQAEGEKAAMEIGKVFNDRNPIAKHLPYKTFQYSIGYRMDQSDPSGNSIIIEIDALEGYRQSAIYRIQQLGFDPTDFTINFRNYENPFSL